MYCKLEVVSTMDVSENGEPNSDRFGELSRAQCTFDLGVFMAIHKSQKKLERSGKNEPKLNPSGRRWWTVWYKLNRIPPEFIKHAVTWFSHDIRVANA